MSDTLEAFTKDEKERAHLYLATQVAEMMGRKFEEGDWSKVYAAAKSIPEGRWSNLSIDITHGSLGVEQKMICRPSHKSVLDACGTTIMHPAGTRAIRIPNENDPTLAAREVLRQYGELVDERTAIVRVVHAFSHGLLSREAAVGSLANEARMSAGTAAKTLSEVRAPVGNSNDQPDMRMGWLLWSSDLSEFLYFEQRMQKPNPTDFVAEWKKSGGGRRRASRNLWVYREATREKVYSITTDAGAKIQPYFTVPLPNDPHLYHFVVQGEEVESGFVRIWLTRSTADLLEQAIGPLTPENIKAAVASARLDLLVRQTTLEAFSTTAVPVIIPAETYDLLVRQLEGVSDEHTLKLLVEHMRAR